LAKSLSGGRALQEAKSERQAEAGLLSFECFEYLPLGLQPIVQIVPVGGSPADKDLVGARLNILNDRVSPGGELSPALRSGL
jgi:hypothetical protein